jgi:uncharacterized membrane protein
MLLLFATSQLSFPTAVGQDPVSPKSLLFVAYSDGYVFVDYSLDVNQTYPAVNVTLFGEAFEDLLVVDEQGLPVDFSQINNTILASTLGTGRLKITYFTPDLTSKLGRIWTLSTEVPINVTVKLPFEASIVSLGTVPELIESQDGVVILVMPPGLLEVSYIIERRSFQQIPDMVLWALVIVSAVVIGIVAYWRIGRRTGDKKEKTRRVNIEEILREHGDLREEEMEAIRFLAEKNGRAYEAELYERLDIPRTSTWRLIKRLEKMEIVDITKSRRQNIVSVRKQYVH